MVWGEHKPNGTNVTNYPPMALAQASHDSGAGYPIDSFSLS